MHITNFKKVFFIPIFIFLLSCFPSSGKAGQAEDINACVRKAKEIAGVKLNEFTAKYESHLLNDNVVRWNNARCDISFGEVNNLNYNGYEYVYRGFPGREFYELNTVLETATKNTIVQLNSRIAMLESRMNHSTKSLKEKTMDLMASFDHIKKGIIEPIHIKEIISALVSAKPKSKQKTELPNTPPSTKKSNTELMEGIYYVTADNLNERLAPNDEATVTNVIYRGQKVEIFETINNWARISHFYDGRVEGISGQVARWVSAQYLSKTIPAKPRVTVNSSLGEAIKKSDDFSKYQRTFEDATKKLVESGQCNLAELKEIGGWVRSPSKKPLKVYFIHCGGFHTTNRIYLDVESARIFH